MRWEEIGEHCLAAFLIALCGGAGFLIPTAAVVWFFEQRKK